MNHTSGKTSRLLRLSLIAGVVIFARSVVMPAANPPGEAPEPIEPGETFIETHRLGIITGIQLPLPCGGWLLVEHGTVSDFAGPSGGDYVITQGTSNFSSPVRFYPASARGTCEAGGTLRYGLSVSAPAGRPAQHWDASFTETVTGRISEINHWAIHIGESFADVPRSDPFYKKVETLLHNGITTGCSLTEYCPGQSVSSGQLAIILARTLAGGGANVPSNGFLNFVPYDCSPGGTSLFTDVAPTDAVCKHVHYLATKNVALGCSATALCPSTVMTRAEIAKFIAQSIVAPGGDAAVPDNYYTAYDCNPESPNVHFTDVPATDPFCKYVHYLWVRANVSGCSPTTFCPEVDVTREQMAKFIVDEFHLKLP